MKELLTVMALSVFLLAPALAQKYAYVDTDYILENIPEYKDAQSQLDDLSAIYQEEIEAKYAEIQTMYKNFQVESVLMPDEVKEKKQQDIKDREKELRELQNQRFGPEGDLFMKREELVKPIQEKIYNAIEEIAEESNYAFVFDRAGSLSILYVNSKFDISDDILDKVGAELGTVRREDRTKREYIPSEPPQQSGKGTPPTQGPGTRSPGPVTSPKKK